MQKFLLFSCLVSCLCHEVIGSCEWPNGTDRFNYWWQEENPNFKVQSLILINKYLQPTYPITIDKPFYAILYVNNQGSQIDQIQVDISLSSLDSTSCKWNLVQTAGILKGLDGCKIGFECPIPQGAKFVKVKIDLSQFPSVRSLLKNDSPYQWQITVTDKATGNKIVITDQARIQLS